MECYGAVEEQLHSHSFSDLDLPLTIDFSDISLSSLLHPASPIEYRDRERQSFGSSEWQSSDSLAQNCALAQDDHHTQATERPRKRRNQIAQTHKLTEKRRRHRIKARMKVLQELIPNSQNLDRASLLEKVISHIKTLQWHLQIMHGMKSYPYSFPPPLRYAQATELPPFVPPIPSNMGFRTGLSSNMSTIQQHFALGVPYTLPFWRSTGNFMPMPSLPPNGPNPYFQSPTKSTFMPPQFPATSPK